MSDNVIDQNMGQAAPPPDSEMIRISEQYNVPYQDIQVWKEQGIAIGDIREAYRLSQEMQMAPVEIFEEWEQHHSDWGELEKALRMTPDHVQHKENPEKTEGEKLVPGGAAQTRRSFYADNALMPSKNAHRGQHTEGNTEESQISPEAD
jgi:hypothetical protein